jgi:hypothetical protein
VVANLRKRSTAHKRCTKPRADGIKASSAQHQGEFQPGLLDVASDIVERLAMAILALAGPPMQITWSRPSSAERASSPVSPILAGRASQPTGVRDVDESPRAATVLKQYGRSRAASRSRPTRIRRLEGSPTAGER